ncbi:MAG: agmatinase family protein [Bacteroidetes bacterium]|nr:MAG: agmatinase family protein [Bacteroidota bacterium]
MKPEFDPNDIGIANGNIFGFPVSEEEAKIVIIPVPWDATASYGKGTSDGPQAILQASTQLDFFHPELPKAYETAVFMTPISEEWKEINEALCLEVVPYLDYLEQGGKLSDSKEYQGLIGRVSEAQNALKEHLKERALELIDRQQIPAVLGGEHSTILGNIQAINERYEHFGILQIDAHADLRDAYEGFEQSHASIMFNVLKSCQNMRQLVQVGIRDICDAEYELTEESTRISCFFDWDLKKAGYEGKSWDHLCDQILERLPEHVYLSFDIDGLRPELCPNTGTPVPGGFQLEEVSFLLFKLVHSGRKIIGFDLNEVAPDPNSEWDANVGARALWELVCAAELSRRKA